MLRLRNEILTRSSQIKLSCNSKKIYDKSFYKEPQYPYTPRCLHISNLQNRRSTFRNYPQTIKVNRLIKSGLYYIGVEDYVRCYYCGIGLGDFRHGDDPFRVHSRYSPYCPLLGKISNSKSSSEIWTDIAKRSSKNQSMTHPKMKKINVRNETFKCRQWEEFSIRNGVSQKPFYLAEAGFFYTGKEDAVLCYYCDGGLKHWEPCDDPWIEHARWFPYCKFIQFKKGKRFILRCVIDQHTKRGHLPNMEDIFDVMEIMYDDDEVVTEPRRIFQETPQASCIETLVPEEYDVKEINTRYLCVICKMRAKSMVLVPCGHKYTCEMCTSNLKQCLHCNTVINRYIKNVL